MTKVNSYLLLIEFQIRKLLLGNCGGRYYHERKTGSRTPFFGEIIILIQFYEGFFVPRHNRVSDRNLPKPTDVVLTDYTTNFTSKDPE